MLLFCYWDVDTCAVKETEMFQSIWSFFFSSLCLSCPNLGGSSRNSTVRAYLSFAQGFCRLCAVAELWTGNSTSCLHPAGLGPGAPPVPPGSSGSPLDADFPWGPALTYKHLQQRPDVTPVDNWSDNWSLVLDRKDNFVTSVEIIFALYVLFKQCILGICQCL